MKWLAACDPIGAVSDPMIASGHDGSIGNPITTAVLEMLNVVPFDIAVEADKEFLIENKCVMLGGGCIQPMKMIDHQNQQSIEDAALTQKVGKPTIVIEQCNGGVK